MRIYPGDKPNDKTASNTNHHRMDFNFDNHNFFFQNQQPLSAKFILLVSRLDFSKHLI